MKQRCREQSITVGVDFDNTLVCYDTLFYRVAVERGLIRSQTSPIKKLVRDSIRELPEGEIEWQKLQAVVYGPRIGEATPAPGSSEFLEKCARHNIKVKIISHKTEYANYDETGTNLRHAAVSWLEQHRFFDGPSCGLSKGDVYFESTRKDKLDRIGRLGCTHFIDDLEEIFLEESFPTGVATLLYAPTSLTSVPATVEVAGDWRQLTEHLFHA